jgi:hypothetical protein
MQNSNIYKCLEIDFKQTPHPLYSWYHYQLAVNYNFKVTVINFIYTRSHELARCYINNISTKLWILTVCVLRNLFNDRISLWISKFVVGERHSSWAYRKPTFSIHPGTANGLLGLLSCLFFNVDVYDNMGWLHATERCIWSGSKSQTPKFPSGSTLLTL